MLFHGKRIPSSRFPKSRGEHWYNSLDLYQVVEGHGGDLLFHLRRLPDLYGKVGAFLLPPALALLWLRVQAMDRVLWLTPVLVVYGLFSLPATKMPSYTLVVSAFFYVALGALLAEAITLLERMRRPTTERFLITAGLCALAYFSLNVPKMIRTADQYTHYLAGEGPYPDFRTINRFRVRHQNDFAWMLLETIELAREAGLGKLGIVAIDGTKVRANTSRHKAMSYGRMRKEEKRLKREILAILAKMDEVNAQEDEEHGEDDDGSGGLPQELQDKKQRLARIEELRGRLEAERGDRLTDKSQKSFADPDAQMMRASDGALTYAYNGQAAVSEDGLIVATGHTTDVNDSQQLVPMVEEVEGNTSESPGTILADNGYLTEKNLRTLRERGQKCLVAVAREFRRPRKWPQGAETRRMHLIQRLPWAKTLYGRRKTQGERPFAEIKQVMNFRRHALRGREKAAGEWNLVAAAYNLRRLYVLGQALA